jgi:hypothetical protein
MDLLYMEILRIIERNRATGRKARHPANENGLAAKES